MLTLKGIYGREMFETWNAMSAMLETSEVLRERIAKRGVSQRALDPKPVEAAGGRTVRQLVLIKQGIEMETAKKIVKAVKDSKIKVQAQIQGDELRVSGKNRDDLQSAIASLKQHDFGVPLDFTNFRD